MRLLLQLRAAAVWIKINHNVDGATIDGLWPPTFKLSNKLFLFLLWPIPAKNMATIERKAGEAPIKPE